MHVCRLSRQLMGCHGWWHSGLVGPHCQTWLICACSYLCSTETRQPGSPSSVHPGTKPSNNSPPFKKQRASLNTKDNTVGRHIPTGAGLPRECAAEDTFLELLSTCLLGCPGWPHTEGGSSLPAGMGRVYLGAVDLLLSITATKARALSPPTGLTLSGPGHLNPASPVTWP